jgi:hypothetical protein
MTVALHAGFAVKLWYFILLATTVTQEGAKGFSVMGLMTFRQWLFE